MATQVRARTGSIQLETEENQGALSPDSATVSEKPCGVTVTQEKATPCLSAPTSATDHETTRQFRSMLDVDDPPQSTVWNPHPLPKSCTPFIQEQFMQPESEELQVNSATPSSSSVSENATDSSRNSSSLRPLTLHLVLFFFWARG